MLWQISRGGVELLYYNCGFSWAIACACFTVLVTSTITTSTHSVTDIPIVSHIATTTASTSLPDRIITDHTDITNNTVHRQPSYNISTGGDNSNLCSNGSSTAASAGISAFWYLVVLSASLVVFLFAAGNGISRGRDNLLTFKIKTQCT